MRNGLCLSPVLVLWLSAPLLGTDPQARFQALLSEAKAHPDRADWKALRLAFSKTPAYRPYSTEELDTAPVEQELKNGENPVALLALDRILEGHWVDPSAHAYAASVCAGIGETERVRLHETFRDGLLGAILETGNGQSFAGAWPVLTIREEYVVLDIFHLKSGKQKPVCEDGHFYDVHTFKNPATGQELTIYFNVDLPRRWLREHGPGR